SSPGPFGTTPSGGGKEAFDGPRIPRWPLGGGKKCVRRATYPPLAGVAPKAPGVDPQQQKIMTQHTQPANGRPKVIVTARAHDYLAETLEKNGYQVIT